MKWFSWGRLLILDVFFTIYFFIRALMYASENDVWFTLFYALAAAGYVWLTQNAWRHWREERNRGSS